MPRQSDDEKSPLPSASDYVTPPTDMRKCGAERISFSGEGSSSVPSPVKEIKIREAGTGSGAERSQAVRSPCNGHRISSCSSISV
jgi:hypothetical protein